MDSISHSPRRIVLTTAGSLGDLHPYIAIASELQARGHHPVIASIEQHREKVLANNLEFHPIRVLGDDWQPEKAKAIMTARQGPDLLVRQYIMPNLRLSYDDIHAVARDADFLVSHPITYAAPLVAEKLSIPWIDTVLAPLSFLSAHDPSILAPAAGLRHLRFLGPTFHAPLFKFMKWTVRSWSEPWHRLREELNLAPAPDPMFQSSKNTALVLALFSSSFAKPQPDWPPNTTLTGFAFFDEQNTNVLGPELSSFLENGPPPIVFTLGSAAVLNPGKFYEHAAEAARLLNRRAVLLTGDENNAPPTLPNGVAAFPYAPFAALFPKAAAVVHSGGIGTTAQAIRAGVPSLIVPWAFDQFDNAARVTRLKLGQTLYQHRATPSRIAASLKPLLDDPSYTHRAHQAAMQLRSEQGTSTACDVIERHLRAGR